MHLYHERLRIVPTGIMVLLIMVFMATIAFMCWLMVSEGYEADSPDGIVMIVSIVFILALMVIIPTLSIRTTVTDEMLKVGLLWGRKVKLTEIESVAVEDFRALKDFLGWGLRFGRKGLGYIAAGTDKGLRINLRSGKTFLISTKNYYEFESVMNMVLKKDKGSGARSQT